MTQTDIANLALTKIGESLIDDIDDADDKNSRKAKLHYVPALKEVLRAHFWGFAMVMAHGIPANGYGETHIEISGSFTVDGDTVAMPWLYLSEIESAGYPTWRSTHEEFPAIIYLYVDGAPEGQARFFFQGPGDSGVVPVGQWVSALFDLATMPGPGGATGWEPFDLEPSGAAGSPTIRLVDPADQVLGWEAAFSLPADFLKLRRVLTTDAVVIDRFDFRRVEGSACIVAGDHAAISLEYVQFLDEPDAYDPLFLQAFVTLLASRLARAITGDEKLESQLLATYEQLALSAARTADAHDSQSNENHPLKELLAGNLLGSRGDFFPEDYP